MQTTFSVLIALKKLFGNQAKWWPYVGLYVARLKNAKRLGLEDLNT